MLSGNCLHSRLSDEWLLLYINFYQTQGTITLKKPLGHFASQSTISLHVKGERLDLNNEKLIFWTHPDLPSKLKFSPHKQQRYHHLSWRFHFELLCSTNSWSSYNSTHTLKILWAKTKQKSWCQISSPLRLGIYHLVIWWTNKSSTYIYILLFWSPPPRHQAIPRTNTCLPTLLTSLDLLIPPPFKNDVGISQRKDKLLIHNKIIRHLNIN